LESRQPGPSHTNPTPNPSTSQTFPGQNPGTPVHYARSKDLRMTILPSIGSVELAS